MKWEKAPAVTPALHMQHKLSERGLYARILANVLSLLGLCYAKLKQDR